MNKVVTINFVAKFINRTKSWKILWELKNYNFPAFDLYLRFLRFLFFGVAFSTNLSWITVGLVAVIKAARSAGASRAPVRNAEKWPNRNSYFLQILYNTVGNEALIGSDFSKWFRPISVFLICIGIKVSEDFEKSDIFSSSSAFWSLSWIWPLVQKVLNWPFLFFLRSS